MRNRARSVRSGGNGRRYALMRNRARSVKNGKASCGVHCCSDSQERTSLKRNEHCGSNNQKGQKKSSFKCNALTASDSNNQKEKIFECNTLTTSHCSGRTVPDKTNTKRQWSVALQGFIHQKNAFVCLFHFYEKRANRCKWCSRNKNHCSMCPVAMSLINAVTNSVKISKTKKEAEQ